jgi:hypothetical protein
MTRDSDAAYCCPKCGATSALLIPGSVLRDDHVAVKCLQCAHVLRMPRRHLGNAAGRRDSTRSLE